MILMSGNLAGAEVEALTDHESLGDFSVLNKPFGGSELAKAKNQCLVHFYSDFETTLDQAIQIGLLETLDRPRYWDDFSQRLMAVEAEDLQRVAAQSCSPEQAIVGTLCDGPREI